MFLDARLTTRDSLLWRVAARGAHAPRPKARVQSRVYLNFVHVVPELHVKNFSFHTVTVPAEGGSKHEIFYIRILIQKRPRGAPRMRGMAAPSARLSTPSSFDLDHNKGPELAADRLAWRAMLHIGILLDRKLTREHPLRPHRHMGKSRSTTYF